MPTGGAVHVTAGWQLVVYGKPAPQGSKVRTKYGMREASKGTAPWRATIKAAGLEARERGAQPILGPVVARVVFTVKRPSGARKADRVPVARPDLDKYLRAVFDGITEAGLWEDDARVVEVARLAKVWDGYDGEALPVPGVLILAAPYPDYVAVDDCAGRQVARFARRRLLRPSGDLPVAEVTA